MDLEVEVAGSELHSNLAVERFERRLAVAKFVVGLDDHFELNLNLAEVKIEVDLVVVVDFDLNLYLVDQNLIFGLSHWLQLMKLYQVIF